ncbi:MAG: THUMP domain-containing protein [Bacteroides sp.]|nr:THUMP domain-containing protein [Bacteroides sp.]MCM1413054.1 THUMP domain-containing protein [Bacteroides sp.]MCM1471760.1 THUMP domain-containing protein [Bacteroides sp.]
MNTNEFEMVAKTFQGLEDVLAEELRGLGAKNVEPGRRMVSFTGDLAMLYKANFCCRTALRILKPIYKFKASDPDQLYSMIKEFDWNTVISLDKTFAIDTVANSDEFTHSRYVTYRVKDGIVDWFKDRFGPESRPRVRLQDADVLINVHINGENVTVSLDSSGESLHKRGYRVAQTEAPINEVLAAGIILKSGWRGDCPFVDPMCGSGTFLIEAALIGAGINPGVYRRRFAFEAWPDFDAALFDEIYNDESGERALTQPILGADMSPKAVAIATENIKNAGVGKYIDLQVKPLSKWEEAPAGGVLVTNPPYGERIGSDDMDGLYSLIGTKLKHVFTGYHAWIIGYREEYFRRIGLSPSFRMPIYNGALECELREYVIFEGDYKTFRSNGGAIHHGDARPQRKNPGQGKSGRPARFDKFDKKDAPRRSGWKARPEEQQQEQSEVENILARHRNEHALKMVTGKAPSLPPSDKPLIRPRRGWKKS